MRPAGRFKMPQVDFIVVPDSSGRFHVFFVDGVRSVKFLGTAETGRYVRDTDQVFEGGEPNPHYTYAGLGYLPPDTVGVEVVNAKGLVFENRSRTDEVPAINWVPRDED
jgi:hypothetical protein